MKSSKIKSHISRGAKHEMEQASTIRKIKNNPRISTQKAAELIAKDHLKDDPKYYERLEIMKMEKGKSPTGSFFDDASIEELNSDYPKRSAEWIWDNWTLEQRDHFLYDHNDETRLLTVRARGEVALTDWKELAKDVKEAIGAHIKMGRYADGDKISPKKNYDALIDIAEKQSSINKLIINEHGVIIEIYNPESDAYVPPIAISKAELLAIALKSFSLDKSSKSTMDNVIVWLLETK